MRGIAGRLAIFISLVALVATASVGYMVYRGAEASLIDAASERVSHTAETVSVRMWATLGAIGDDVRFLAGTPPVQGIVRATLQRGGLDPQWSMWADEWGVQLLDIFNSLIDSRSAYLQIRFIGLANDGRELVSAARGDTTSRVGVSEMATHGDASYVRVASQLAEGALYLSEVAPLRTDLGDVADTQVIHVATPIYTDAGDPFGVLVVTVDIRAIMAPLGSMVDANQTLYVANRRGDLLHASGRSGFGGDEAVQARWRRLQPVVSELLTGSPTEIRMLDARLAAETRGIAYFEEVSLDPSHESSSLFVGVTEPHETILAGVRRVRNQSALITLLLSLAALGLALGAARYFTQPLRQITAAVSNFGGDDEREPLPVDRTDEIGLLARSFESMERQIEEQIGVLEDEERRQRTILETSAEGIVVVDENGRIEAFNPAAEHIFRMDGEDVVGEPLDMLIPSDIVESLLKKELDDRAIGFEAIGKRSDGVDVPISILWSQFEWRDERKLTVFLQDISERKEAEQAREQLVKELENERERLRKLSETLEERVRDRTMDLERLNRELEVTNRELREIASVASHDLQEPLRKLRAFADLLGSEYGDALDEGGRFYTERIFGISERMSKLINDLLAFSSVTSRPGQYQKVDLRAVATDAVADLRGPIETSGASVEIGELPEVEADPRQIRELFEQLIENAIIYRRPDAAPRIRIRGSVQNDTADVRDPALCVLEIEDNGIGFDEKYAGRIFAPFERIARRTASEGTGMGLTICRRIAENHRGSIIALSTLGVGSTFIVTLPIRQQARSGVLAEEAVSDVASSGYSTTA